MANRYLTLKGVRVNNLKNIDLKIPRDKLVVLPGCPAPENLLLHLKQSMPRGTAVLWNHFPPMPACFWDSWTSRTSIPLKGYPPPFRLIKKPHRKIPARRSVR